jgi:response regulator of citrate/malate metabolism
VIHTLVIEDDPVVAEVNIGYIERMPGFVPVGACRTGSEAIAITARRRVDLVLLDFGLPDMTGIEVCHALLSARRPSASPVGIIAVTAARDADTVRDAIAHGVAQYLIKPYSFATFRDKLDRYAAYRQWLPEGEVTDQPGVDRALETLRGSAATDLPKGLSSASYDLVASALRDGGRPLSAAEIAAATGLSRVSARRYLDYLRQQGMATLVPRYGSTGRPEHHYRWSGPVRSGGT